MKSPRTMGRRFQAIARKREERSTKFERYMNKWLAEKGSATKFLDFDAMEFAKMQHLKNIAAFRDTVVLAMEAVLNHIRPDYAAEDGSLAGMSLKSKDSDGGASSKSKKSESTKKGRLPVPSTSSSSSIAANKKGLLKRIGMSKDSQDDEQTREDDTSQFTAGDDTASLAASQATMSVALRGGPSVMLGLSAPGPPTRDLGLSIAIRSSTFVFKEERGSRMKSRRDGEVSPKMLSQMMRQLDVIIWEALRCYTADDVVKKFLLEDMHPPMQSCIHFADDTEEIWCSSRKNLGETAVEEAKAAKAAALIAKPLPIAAVVLPTSSKESVIFLVSFPNSDISAIPPALSATGP